jgi:hypothetical protein
MLETAIRTQLQLRLMVRMLGERSQDEQAVGDWIDRYGEAVAEIVDGLRGKEVDRLARSGNMEGAAAELKKLLESERK